MYCYYRGERLVAGTLATKDDGAAIYNGELLGILVGNNVFYDVLNCKFYDIRYYNDVINGTEFISYTSVWDNFPKGCQKFIFSHQSLVNLAMYINSLSDAHKSYMKINITPEKTGKQLIKSHN